MPFLGYPRDVNKMKVENFLRGRKVVKINNIRVRAKDKDRTFGFFSNVKRSL